MSESRIPWVSRPENATSCIARAYQSAMIRLKWLEGRRAPKPKAPTPQPKPKRGQARKAAELAQKDLFS